MATATIVLPRRRPRPRPIAGRAPDICYVKAIDNSRLQREVDPKKRHDCLGLLGLAAVVFSVFMLYAWQHSQCRRFSYQIEQLKTRQAGLEEWNQRLLYEQATLEDRQRISTLAGEKLDMRPRDPQQVIPLDGAPALAPADAPVLARNNQAGQADDGQTSGERTGEP